MEDAQISHVQGEQVAFKRLLWAGPLDVCCQVHAHNSLIRP